MEALRAHAGKPEPGSYLDALLRRMLIDSDNDAANQVESLFGGGTRVDELLRGLGLVDTWMGGGYLRETAGCASADPDAGREPAVLRLLQVHDRVRPRPPARLGPPGRRRPGAADRRYGREFTQSDARYLLYLLAHVPDRAKLGRFLAGGPYALLHKAGWISSARHDAGLVYWPGRRLRRRGDDVGERGRRSPRTCSPDGSREQP